MDFLIADHCEHTDFLQGAQFSILERQLSQVEFCTHHQFKARPKLTWWSLSWVLRSNLPSLQTLQIQLWQNIHTIESSCIGSLLNKPISDLIQLASDQTQLVWIPTTISASFGPISRNQIHTQFQFFRRTSVSNFQFFRRILKSNFQQLLHHRLLPSCLQLQ